MPCVTMIDRLLLTDLFPWAWITNRQDSFYDSGALWPSATNPTYIQPSPRTRNCFFTFAPTMSLLLGWLASFLALAGLVSAVSVPITRRESPHSTSVRLAAQNGANSDDPFHFQNSFGFRYLSTLFINGQPVQVCFPPVSLSSFSTPYNPRPKD